VTARGAQALLARPRARTARDLKHTNAFKINEDVVIPRERLGEYTDGIERINIEFSIANKLKLIEALREFFSGELPTHPDAKVDRDTLFGDRPQRALGLLEQVAGRWRFIVANFERVASNVRTDLEGLGMDSARIGDDPELTVFERVQLHQMRISWKQELRDPLRDIFGGRDFEPLMAAVEKIHAEVLRGRVFVALHMHAGDGNVHTNIPVNSDNYEMLRQANEAVARIMAFARSLGGVISGEHGIGLTKHSSSPTRSRLSSTTRSAWTPRGASIAASSCPERTCAARTRPPSR
jgi:FAD/FMN-containing dehydrogenase